MRNLLCFIVCLLLINLTNSHLNLLGRRGWNTRRNNRRNRPSPRKQKKDILPMCILGNTPVQSEDGEMFINACIMVLLGKGSKNHYS